MAQKPKPAGHTLFAWLLAAAIIIYGALAVTLSMRIIDQQSGIRRNLYAALEILDRLHQDAMVQAHSPLARQTVQETWRDARAFAAVSPTQARHVAAQLVTRLNREFPHNPCGQPGPAFVPEGTLPKHHACMVVVGIRGNDINVTGYDTQGIAMDNFYEFLYPPVGHSD